MQGDVYAMRGSNVLFLLGEALNFMKLRHCRLVALPVLIVSFAMANAQSDSAVAVEPFVYEGKYSFPNPHDTHYFLGSSGAPLGKGKGYYQNIMVSINSVNYGVTKNISIGGGLELISLFKARNPIWFLTPKVGFDISKDINIGGGVMLLGIKDGIGTGLGYSIFTYGNAESNVTGGVGFGYKGDELGKTPMILISGMHRAGNSVSLLTENFIFPSQNRATLYFGIHGIRFLRRNNAFDLGLIVIPNFIIETPVFPYVGYARTF